MTEPCCYTKICRTIHGGLVHVVIVRLHEKERIMSNLFLLNNHNNKISKIFDFEFFNTVTKQVENDNSNTIKV